jgi:bidirectional [NiFe] hydrogenase diaphorase subunit
MSNATVAVPSDDKRWKLVNATMRRNGFRPDALIETLHTIQESFGYLDDKALTYVSEALGVSPSQVYGVATFYHFFNLKPKGKHVCSVCTGTACYIKGSGALLEKIEEQYGIKAGGTTADSSLSLLTVRCVGACGLAPAVVIDNEVSGNQTIESTLSKLEEVLKS